MAHIIDPEQVNKSAVPVPPLARASWDSQVDIYKLARQGNRACQRRWNELCSYPPSAGTVRLIVKVTAEEDEKDRHAGEQMEALITKAAGSSPAEPTWIADAASSPDPAMRELAWKARHGNG